MSKGCNLSSRSSDARDAGHSSIWLNIHQKIDISTLTLNTHFSYRLLRTLLMTTGSSKEVRGGTSKVVTTTCKYEYAIIE